MMYPGYQTDRDECRSIAAPSPCVGVGETALMLWIMYRPGEDIP